jgi:hypothetical protein
MGLYQLGWPAVTLGPGGADSGAIEIEFTAGSGSRARSTQRRTTWAQRWLTDGRHDSHSVGRAGADCDRPMHGGVNLLALLLQEAFDPHGEDLYVFRGKNGRVIRILWHDGFACRTDSGRRLRWVETIKRIDVKGRVHLIGAFIVCDNSSQKSTPRA